ncbi:energy-coupling factor transporter ATPase [Halalkalibacter sp. AB-rgal2]|uniref:energy-coupling factor transporter ATPase n=1 Tax=Halalkalibacter sp. AB-rgal2 TaxID=3242695 RepID=UPI00359D4E82
MDIVFNNVSHIYMRKTPFEKYALKNIEVTIPSGSFTAIIGATGSGKSTFTQHINGLLTPTEGTVQIGSHHITRKSRGDMRALRQDVGYIFQYPEHQLFEETVEKDICFGPLNFDVSESDAKRKAHTMIELVGLSKDVLQRSPFELSGGQMRRVAIAGVLASEPKVIVLDEPTASLDPIGREEMMTLFTTYQKEHEATIVLVTHQMDEVARYADHVIVMNKGEITMHGTPSEVFSQGEMLSSVGLHTPPVMKLGNLFKRRLNLGEWPTVFDEGELAEHMATFLLSRREK